MSIRPEQRHGRHRACPVCLGGAHLAQRRRVRCNGFTSLDGRWCRCSREEHAGGLPPEESDAGTVYVHRLDAPCRCGLAHGGTANWSGQAASSAGDHPAALGWTFRAPVPDGAPPPPWEGHSARRPSAVYPWTDRAGRPCFYTLRFEFTEDGRRRKVVTPRTVWERPDGSLVWAKAGPPPGWRRPLFNLPAIVAHPGRSILVVEGERTAIAAARLAPEHVVTTWHGGSGAVDLADWGPLAGHPVTVWPDADAAGAKAAAAVAAAGRNVGAALVRVVKLPAGLPSGWDLADPWPAGMEVAPWMA